MVHYSDNGKNSKRIKADIFQPLAYHIAPPMVLILQKKGGFDVDLLACWPQIVGETLAQLCVPFKLKRARGRDDLQATPVTLLIACEGFACLKIQHQADEIIQKINLFLGSQLINRIKIVQKSLHLHQHYPPPKRPLSQSEMCFLEKQAAFIEDDALRTSMIRLGKNIMVTTSTP